MSGSNILRCTRQRQRLFVPLTSPVATASLPRQVLHPFSIFTPSIKSVNTKSFLASTTQTFVPSSRHTYSTKKPSNMSTFSKETITPGDGTTFPKVGQTVIMEYTGWLYEPSKDKNRGQQFDSSVGRGDFKTAIGVGRVIKGWDQGVPQMSVGERAVLTIPGNMAYGKDGYPGLIPPNATLIL